MIFVNSNKTVLSVTSRGLSKAAEQVLGLRGVLDPNVFSAFDQVLCLGRITLPLLAFVPSSATW